MHGVTLGKVTTAKRFLLALGLHNLTGQKKGHRDQQQTGTLQAQKIAEMSTALLLKPNNETDIVLTYFWVANFDVTIEKQSGGGLLIPPT